MAVVMLIVLLFLCPINSTLNKKIEALSGSSSGLTINGVNDRYFMTNPISETIRTYEAWIDTYETGVNQGSTIFGNYTEQWMPGISFRIYTYNSKIGQPQLNIRLSANEQYQYNIATNICGTGKRHVAFTISNNQIKGYLDGSLKKTWSYNYELPIVSSPYSVGGDSRPDNTWWFRGTIYSVAAYNSVKSASQIAENMNLPVTKTNDLIAGWNFDLSMNNVANDGNELYNHFFEKKFIDPNTYDYTFAVIGDTQTLLDVYPDDFHCIYDCLLEKKDYLKLKLAMGLGDITELNLDNEYTIAREQIYRLSGEIPFTIIRGNHDLSNYGGLSEEWRNVKFGQYFDNDTYRNELTGLYNNSPENAFKCINVCGINYLILMLDYGASDDVLDWANDIVELYPNHNVIVTTHAFLFRDGTTLDVNDLVPPSKKWGYNNGDDIWNKFISKHSNIKLVLSGHDPYPEIVRSEFVGNNGNKVNCLLIDPQHIDKYYGSTGLIAFLHFSNNGKNVSVEYYSSVTGEFFETINQFEIEIETTNDNAESFNYTGGEFVEASSITNGDNIFLSSNNMSLGFFAEQLSTFTDQNINPCVPNDRRLVFELQSTNNGKYFLKTPSDKYLSTNNGTGLIVSDVAEEFVINSVDDGFVFFSNNKYVSLLNENNLSDNPEKVSIYKYVKYSDDSTETAIRYFNKFCNSYICGFDDYTTATLNIFNILKDDYFRLSNDAKNEIKMLIKTKDYRAESFTRKYERILSIHQSEEGFYDFIGLNNSLQLQIASISPKNNYLLFVIVVFGPTMLLSFLAIGLNKRRKK